MLLTADARCSSLRQIRGAHGDATHQVIILSTSEEAGIKMATDEELGADKAKLLGHFKALE